MEQYFLIAQSGIIDTKNVIEVAREPEKMHQHTSQSNVFLELEKTFLDLLQIPHMNELVSECNGGDRQLWRWTSDGLLENKYSKLVITVKGRRKKEETKVVAGSREGGLHQKWLIKNGVIRSRISDDLNMTKRTDDLLVVCRHDDGYDQKWRLVPEAKWGAYELYLLNPNALMKTMFLKTILREDLECLIGCTIEQYENNIKQCVSIGKTCADKLDDVIKDAGIAKVTGGGIAIAGGAASLGGLLLAPFTAGASLVLTVGGGIAAGAGGLTGVGAIITEHCYNDAKVKEIQPLIDLTFRTSYVLESMLLDVCQDMEDAFRFMQTLEGESFSKELGFYLKNGVKCVNQAKSMWDAGNEGLDAFKAIKDAKALGNLIKTDCGAIKAAMKEIADLTAAGGLKVPLTGKVLVKAGSKGAKALSSALSLFGIMFGIIDVVDGVKQFNKGSPTAVQIRMLTREIENQSNQLVATYKELCV